DAIIGLDKINEYVLFVSDAAEFRSQYDNASVVRCAVDSSHRALRYWWEQTILPVQVRTRNLHLLHSLNYVSPVVCPCKNLVTFQDVSYREQVVAMPFARRLGLRFFSTLSARSADLVVTVS